MSKGIKLLKRFTTKVGENMKMNTLPLDNFLEAHDLWKELELYLDPPRDPRGKFLPKEEQD